jgi:rhodanese-related sulfurtransferase
VLVDIREPDEFAARHVKGAISRPLSAFGSARLDIESATDVVFTCKSGMRTQASCTRLAATVNCPAFFLEGGLDAWVAAGLPTEYDRGRSSN